MAFNAANLHLVGGGSGQRLWLYSSTDAATVIRVADYFIDAIEMLNVNDVLIVASATGGTPVVAHMYVNANDGSTVDVVDGVAVTSTDTD